MNSNYDVDVFSDDEDWVIEPIRRSYTKRRRVDHMDNWDDVEFFNRFRLQKGTVISVLNKIEPKLLQHYGP